MLVCAFCGTLADKCIKYFGITHNDIEKYQEQVVASICFYDSHSLSSLFNPVVNECQQ